MTAWKVRTNFETNFENKQRGNIYLVQKTVKVAKKLMVNCLISNECLISSGLLVVTVSSNVLYVVNLLDF